MGGTFRITFTGESEKFADYEHSFGGTYLELVPGQRIPHTDKFESDDPAMAGSLHLFADADVMTPDPSEPFRLIECLKERKGSVDRYRSLVPIVGTAEQWDIPEERAESGADMEAVFTRERLSGWAEAAPERLAATLRLPNCNGFVVEAEPLPLKIFDETVVVVGVDDGDGLPRISPSASMRWTGPSPSTGGTGGRRSR